MPFLRCRHPTCSELLPAKGQNFCPKHATGGAGRVRERRRESGAGRYYDRHRRDREAKRFYDSTAWQSARAERLAAFPVCQKCQIALANTVHHLVPLAECLASGDYEKALSQDYLLSLCGDCHSGLEMEIRRENIERDREPIRPRPNAC